MKWCCCEVSGLLLFNWNEYRVFWYMAMISLRVSSSFEIVSPVYSLMYSSCLISSPMYKPKPCTCEFPSNVFRGIPLWIETLLHRSDNISSLFRFTGSSISVAPHALHKSASHSLLYLLHKHILDSQTRFPDMDEQVHPGKRLLHEVEHLHIFSQGIRSL